MKARKYTLNYYLEFLSKQDNSELRLSLKKFIREVIPSIEDRYRKLSKGNFIDYVAHYEDFWMITTYHIENLEPVAFNIVRYRNGVKHQQYYCLCYVSYFSNETEWKCYKMNYWLKRYCYTWNLRELFKGTEYEYSFVWELGNNIDIKIRNLLVWCNQEHIKNIERLTKLKCYRLARDVMNGSGNFIRLDENIIKAIGLSNWRQMQYVVEKDMRVLDVISYSNFCKSGLDNKYFVKF